MTSPTIEPRTGPKLYHAFSVAAASWFTATAIVTIYGVQSLLIRVGMLDVIASLIGDVVVIAGAVVFAKQQRLGWRALGVRMPDARFILAAVLVGCAAWYVNLRLVVWIRPGGDSHELQTIVEQAPLVPTLLGIAVFPALAEELVFRGIFARTLALRFNAGVGIATSAVVFAVYHLLPTQMVSNLVFGLALAVLAVGADSIVPAMLAHLLNNMIAIVLSRDEVPPLGAWIGAHPTPMLAGALTLVGCGVALAAMKDRPRA